ncbi:YitT family protein [Tabrizicola flagellatus]|uniref:YitT family protein n=1 Tax=Tabrizicola flagellatus TaxID=2593021 RepID=UPI001F23D910|nr:YitT family protein [Tabrizicola flagellatus]
MTYVTRRIPAMPDRPDQIADRPRHSAVDDAQGIAFGVTMAALGMHILTHMGFVTGQTTGLAVLIAHWTGLPFTAVYFGVTLPFLGLAWKRMGAAFALKTLVTTAALSALVAVLPNWVELGRIEPAVAAVLFGLLFGIAALAAIRHGGSFGGLSVLWIELQDRAGFPAGHAQLLSDMVIFGLAALVMPFDTLAYSFLGAAVFSLFLAVNHRRDRYIAA